MKKVFFIIITAYSFYSCETGTEITLVQSKKDSLLDSVYTICKDIYFWNDNLPNSTIFKLYTQKDAKSILEHIRTYSPVHNGKHIDKWSFAINKVSWNAFERNETQGFGFDVVFWKDDDLRVSQVHEASDAFEKGIIRGIRILSINGIEAKFANNELLIKSLKDSKITIDFLDSYENIHKSTILSTNFVNKSIINSKIIDNDIAYFAFDIFEGKNTIKELNDVFAFFAANKAKELIIDLRYNHGGDGNIALALANLIAPKEAEGKVFTRIINNQKNSLFNYSLFFKPSINNNLGIKRVFFITSLETASASEALINSLEAIMDVKLIGSQTHGKPFGFFAIPIGDNYIFPIAFKNVNADGYGDYYDGLPVDIKVEDDLTHDFGDAEESCLKTVLHFIKTNRKLQLNNNIKTLNFKNEKPDLFYFAHPK
jgi:C-terminal processing protease CtpA/Prc